MSSAPRQDSLPDLDVCEREPIHIPGSVEPNGVLLVVQEPDLKIIQASANTGDLLGIPCETLLTMSLAHVFEPQSLEALELRILPKNLDAKRRYLSGVRVLQALAVFDALVHRYQGLLIIELEPAEITEPERSQADVYESLTDTPADLGGPLSLSELCQRVAGHVRSLTGFDRVMVYRFLDDESGWVIAEERRDDLIPYLGLRYPASDIPPQARRLYLLNTLRLKADVYARPIPLVPAINPLTGLSLDMSHCVLRAMSPVHVEYLRNMGVSASMSISIVKDERLWGLIACHHLEPRAVPHRVRISCDVLARVFSAHIAAAEAEDSRHHDTALRRFRKEIAQCLRAGKGIRNTLNEQGGRLASIIQSTGVAICLGGEIELAGATPTPDDVKHLLKWLTVNQNDYVLWTEKLRVQYPGAEGLADTASGLLSARIALGSSDFILWFRPAVVRVVEWAGDPAKPVEETEIGKRISPRLSFERWKQTVGDQSEPWRDYEREFALSLRQDIAEALLVQQNKEVTHLNGELARSNIELDAFAYAASHDLQEPVRTIRAFAQLLSRRAGSALDDQAQELLTFIEQGADRMGRLISALLAYGQVGGMQKREKKPVELEEVLRWVLLNLEDAVRVSGAVVTHDSLPTVIGDPDQLTELFQNLMINAIKYRKPGESPRIHVAASPHSGLWQVSVRDNGIGFAQHEAESIFGAFKRLHGRDIPGTGIGLALCRRIVGHHGGSIWAESEGKDRGATFWFTLSRS
jgi:chemotaxis family two-component system sensor kinase Cph1